VTEVIRGAAALDPDIDALWTWIQAGFRDNQRAIIESIEHKQALNDTLDIDRATDIVWTLKHPTVWQLLVIQRGWTPTDYEPWLADTSCAHLLNRFCGSQSPAAARVGRRLEAALSTDRNRHRIGGWFFRGRRTTAARQMQSPRRAFVARERESRLRFARLA
jgi:hypothetical protein